MLITNENKKWNLNDINQKLLNWFKKNINDSIVFDSFLTQIKICKIDKEMVFFKTDDNFVENFVETHLKDVVKKGLNVVLEKDVDFVFVKEKTTLKTKESFTKIVDDLKKEEKENFFYDEGDFLMENLTFNNFVKANFNKEIIELSKIVINKEQVEYNPIFIHSNSGLGKSHFLNALGNEVKKQNKKVYYLNPNKFINIISTSLQEKNSVKLNNYADMLINVDLLLVDDVQIFGNKTKSLEILFNVINELIKNNKQIVICADKKPRFLGGFEDRFITRFENGLTLEIKQPSNDDLKKILKFKIEKQKLEFNNWDESSLNFLTRNFYKSIRELEGALNKIKFFSKDVTNMKYTEIVLNNIFNDIKISKQSITPERIIQCVANYYRVKPSEITSKSRRKDLVIARNMAVWLMRKSLFFAYEKIGKYLGGKNHSSILASYKKISNQIQKGSEVKNAALSIEEKISKIT
ncbi:chromosomal replication initiator protein DnaA [Mesomycoplasma neurolyticum]|uniref:Chromosomal replication initiator protein DnaA n=1 Tax=Mesomycoplasma neurolyticum TaxID=2120 RepID=A0A449A679_9BACT|nr:chromosomal replication initiator protein DnaA [Mesomycoplasma neurolyticum]VEU59663.1 chromosomal replication initiator protein DnaA [Mesomycoplasma neurolyticum]